MKKAIEEDRYADAEDLLNAFEERGAEWYYQRAMLCKKRSWYLESYRCLKEALELDPENTRCKKELSTLEKMAGFTEEEKSQKRNGGKNFEDSCWVNGFKVCGICCACICSGICDGMSGGC